VSDRVESPPVQLLVRTLFPKGDLLRVPSVPPRIARVARVLLPRGRGTHMGSEFRAVCGTRDERSDLSPLGPSARLSTRQAHWIVWGPRMSVRDTARWYGPQLAALALLAAAARWYPWERHPWVYCGWRQLTGRPCPACGYTRAAHAWMQGDWATATFTCPAIWVVVALVAAVGMLTLIGCARRRIWVPGPGWTSPWVWSVVALVVVANWIWRWSHGLQ
jgi:hypothetical protein